MNRPILILPVVIYLSQRLSHALAHTPHMEPCTGLAGGVWGCAWLYFRNEHITTDRTDLWRRTDLFESLRRRTSLTQTQVRKNKWRRTSDSLKFPSAENVA